MTTSRLSVVYARTRAGQAHVLGTERPGTLTERLLMRLNGYTPLERLLSAAEQAQADGALDELLRQGWIEPVRDDAAAPSESQWGSIDVLPA